MCVCGQTKAFSHPDMDHSCVCGQTKAFSHPDMDHSCVCGQTKAFSHPDMDHSCVCGQTKAFSHPDMDHSAGGGVKVVSFTEAVHSNPRHILVQNPSGSPLHHHALLFPKPNVFIYVSKYNPSSLSRRAYIFIELDSGNEQIASFTKVSTGNLSLSDIKYGTAPSGHQLH